MADDRAMIACASQMHQRPSMDADFLALVAIFATILSSGAALLWVLLRLIKGP
ncbi:hypothetical protein V5F77_06790 [Xanthobacter sp. DSM 24535]|uniref:hypothetical protein n=1 Tax=Roseixanthobacter psychrophilus TaxID=3119917 RepID=UPI0037278146